MTNTPKNIAADTDSVWLVTRCSSGFRKELAKALQEKVLTRRTDKTKALVYLFVYLPTDGQSLMTLAQTYKDSYLTKPGNLVPSTDYSVCCNTSALSLAHRSVARRLFEIENRMVVMRMSNPIDKTTIFRLPCAICIPLKMIPYANQRASHITTKPSDVFMVIT